MAEKNGKIGVFLSNGCGTQFDKEDVNQLAERIYFSGLVDKENILFQKALGKKGIDFIKNETEKRKFDKIILAGYSPIIHAEALTEIVRETGLGESSVRGVPMPGNLRAGERQLDLAAYSLSKAVRAASLVPKFKTETVKYLQSVLVLGGGVAGIEAARACAALGYVVTVIEQTKELGGEHAKWFNAGAGEEEAEKKEKAAEIPGVKFLTESKLLHLEGTVGNYKAEVETADGVQEIEAGAVIIAPGAPAESEIPEELAPVLRSQWTEPMETVLPRVEEMPRKPEVQSIGLVLDINVDETKASTEMALSIAEKIQDPDRYQVHLFCKDVRVAARELERRYDEARQAGVNIVKYDTISIIPEECGMNLYVHDSILNEKVSYFCHLLGLSKYGLRPKPDEELLETTGVLPDKMGRLQENNIRLFPVETNRLGIFVAGAGRGTFYVPEIVQEAKAAASAAHELLSRKKSKVECSNVTVDPDKCVLCLTCIRVCPYKAMHVDKSEGAAASYPEVCQKCGICAGECPAKAITLPVYSDEVITTQL